MNIFLIVSLLALIAATINDLKKREVADWISYSLFAILIISTLIYSIVQNNFYYLLKALAFSLVLYAFLSLMYYSKFIGGGDVKLISALGPVFNFISIYNFLGWILIISGIYGITFSIALAFKNRSKLKLKFNFLLILFTLLFASGIIFKASALIMLSIIAIMPYLILFVHAVEKVSLIKKYPASKLSEGDWLLKNVKIGKNMIMAKAEGLTKEEIEKIRRAKIKVIIKEGIPYVPVFLIAFILSNYLNIFTIIMAFF